VAAAGYFPSGCTWPEFSALGAPVRSSGDRMNEFLNENWKALAEEVRPLMTKALVDILRASVDKLFSSFSYDDLLPKGKN